MGRRRLLPDLNALMLQLHLPHRSSKHASAVSVVSNVASPSSAAYEHKSTPKHDQHHVFSWPSLKRVLSSSSLAGNEKEQGNENHDCVNTNDSKHAAHSHHRSVSFSDCNIRTYPQVLGDHPCCSEGCPIQLGWSYTNETSIKVDEYESLYHNTNTPCQNQGELRLTPEERRSILISTKQQYNKQHSSGSCSSSSEDDTRDQEQDSVFPTADCEQQHERELSRECRRMHRCNDNVKASRKRNRRNQQAFFGTMANGNKCVAQQAVAVAAASLLDAAAAIGADSAPTTIVQNGPC